MPGLLQLLIAAALGLALSGAPVAAQDIRINPVPPHVRPEWTPVPNAPGVYYAPNLPTDVFRHGGKYYFYWQGYLYRGSKPRGPWKSVTKMPGLVLGNRPLSIQNGRNRAGRAARRASWWASPNGSSRDSTGAGGAVRASRRGITGAA